MKNVINYKVASSSHHDRDRGINALNIIVGDFIREGFQPINELVVVKDGSFFCFFQTMIKYDESNSRF